MDMDTIYSVLTYILTTSGACAWIATKLKQVPENKYWALVYKLINFIGGNVFHAQNKVD